MNCLEGLLSIEGIDGSGKSTFLKEFTNNFKAKNVSMQRYDVSPFTEEGIKYIRSLLSNKDKTPNDVKNKSLLYAFISDFILHEYNISEFRKNTPNSIVISDRYILSTIAYQSLTVNFYNVIDIVQKSGIKLPKYIIYLDCSPKIACQRIIQRTKTDGKEVEMFEKESILEKIYSNYQKALDWVKMNSDTIIIECDTGTKPIDEYKTHYIPLIQDVVEKGI